MSDYPFVYTCLYLLRYVFNNTVPYVPLYFRNFFRFFRRSPSVPKFLFSSDTEFPIHTETVRLNPLKHKILLPCLTRFGASTWQNTHTHTHTPKKSYKTDVQLLTTPHLKLSISPMTFQFWTRDTNWTKHRNSKTYTWHEIWRTTHSSGIITSRWTISVPQYL